MADTMGSQQELDYSILLDNAGPILSLIGVVIFVILDVVFFLWLIYQMIRHRRVLYCQVLRQDEMRDTMTDDTEKHGNEGSNCNGVVAHV